MALNSKDNIEALLELKAEKKIAVCLPALNEAETIGTICEIISKDLTAFGFVDDLVVLDGGSIDDSAAIAAQNGARIVNVSAQPGKGAALYESVKATTADFIIWCDADLTSFNASYITSLAKPLLEDPKAMLIKGYYDRRGLENAKTGGGRTTWLVAKPLISLLFPQLAHIKEPLIGEYSISRIAAERVPFFTGYGVELGLLLDVSREFGIDSVRQVNLGSNRVHKNQSLENLSVQAYEIITAALHKAELQPFHPPASQKPASPKDAKKLNNQLEVFLRSDMDPVKVQISELPPIQSDNNQL